MASRKPRTNWPAPLKIEQNGDRLQPFPIRVENDLTCLFYVTVYDGPAVSWLCVCARLSRGWAGVLEVSCNMKEDENSGGGRGSGGAESNTSAVTSDPTQSSGTKESSSCQQSKRQVNWELESRALQWNVCVSALKAPNESRNSL